MVVLTRSRAHRPATPRLSSSSRAEKAVKPSAAKNAAEGVKTWFKQMPSSPLAASQPRSRSTANKMTRNDSDARRRLNSARKSLLHPESARTLRISEEGGDGKEDMSEESLEDLSDNGDLRTDYSEEDGDGLSGSAEDFDSDDDGSLDCGARDRTSSNNGSKGGSPTKRKKTRSGHARRARGISEDDQVLIRNMINEKREPAVIINSANYHPRERRERCPWTPSEVLYLRMGVDRFGFAWADILKCPDFKFHPHRKHIDLKDKWRNIVAYRPYGSHGKRTFTLLDENHQQILRPNSNKPYRFVNRWPRDAALKAASRTEFYPAGQTISIIYVREVGSDALKESNSLPIVHVYEGVRQRQVAPPHLNDIKIRTVWSSDVRKIREERFVSKEDLQRLERLARA